MKEITAYQCEWCKKISTKRAGIKRHEASCHSNPAFNCCENCKHGILKAQTTKTAGFFGDENFDVEPFCNHHETFIFGGNKQENAYFIECDTCDNSGGCRAEVPIPYTCFGFESKGTHGYEYPDEEGVNET